MKANRIRLVALVMALGAVVVACSSADDNAAPAERADVAGGTFAAGSLTFDRALEPEVAWQQPYGIDVDGSGNVYVFDAGNNRVVVFDQSGAHTHEWGSMGSEPGQFDSLGFGGLAIDDDRNVYVVDNGNYRIQKFAADGTFITEWGTQGSNDGEFERPIGIAVADGEVYVTDDAVPFVQVFDPDGLFLRRFGGPGEDPGQFSHATGIAVESGTVWVADYEARRLQRLASDGSPDGVWQLPGPAGTFGVPEGIDVADSGAVLVTSYRGGEIVVLPAEPTSTDEWPVAGGEKGGALGKLTAPVDVAIAPDGAVYVTDQTNNAVLRYVPGAS